MAAVINIIGTTGNNRIGINANTEAAIGMPILEKMATQVVACKIGVGA